MISYKNIRSYISKTARFGLFIPFTNLMLVYGNKIVPKGLLWRMAAKRNLKVKAYIDKVVGGVDNLINELPATTPERTKIIWFCWLQGVDKMPLVPQLCLNSIKKNSNGCQVNIITLDNFNEFISLPQRILRLFHSGNITAAHLSDIIRLALLSKYGGFWIDATMLLVEPLDSRIFEMELYSMKSKAEGFYVSRCRWAGFCFYMQKGSVMALLAHQILQKYWEKEDWLIDYFMIDYIFDLIAEKNENVAYSLDKIPMNNPHLHDLSDKMPLPYNEEEFNRLKHQTSMFKLSWKAFSAEKLTEDRNSYFCYLNSSF